MAREPRVLIIAGFDPSGGAGIVADLETIHKLGGKAAAVVTTVTVQNSKKFSGSTPLPPDRIKAQLGAVFDEFRVIGVKIGMLGNRAIAEAVADVLEKERPPRTVLDPVYRSTTGAILNDDVTFTVVKDRIFPHTAVITPNRSEAEYLLGEKTNDLSAAKLAMKLFDKYSLKAIVITGNEGKSSSFDLVYDGENTNIIQTTRIKAKNTHGTGCRHSSALTHYLSKGIYLNESALLAKDYVLDYLASRR